MVRPGFDSDVLTRGAWYAAAVGAPTGAGLGAALWFPLGAALGAGLGGAVGGVSGLVGGAVLARLAQLHGERHVMTRRSAQRLSAVSHALVIFVGTSLLCQGGTDLPPPTRVIGPAVAAAVFAVIGYGVGPLLVFGSADRVLAERVRRTVSSGLVLGASLGAAVGLGIGVHAVLRGGYPAPLVPVAGIEGCLFGIGPGDVLGIIVAATLLPRLRAAVPGTRTPI